MGVDANSFAVVMNHHFLRDQEILADLLRSPCPYIALLGPQRRTQQLLRELASDGALPDDGADRVYGPAGLDLGGDSSQEIALSIAAEIRAVAAGRKPTHLRARKAPIH